MTRDEAISFLQAHQPMPPTTELEQETVDQYEEARKFFLANPDPICIPLFLNSFGEGDCLGIYQMIGDVMKQFAPDDVVPHLVDSLQSQHRSVRYWSAQIAARFPSNALAQPLSRLLVEDDYDLKYAAITALEQIESPQIAHVLESHKTKEQDEEILQLIDEVLEERARET